MNKIKIDRPLKGKDIVRHNLRGKIVNLKKLIIDTENLQRESLFILDRYPSHREWPTVASFEAKGVLNDARSEVRGQYKASGQTVPADKEIQADMIAYVNKQFYGRLSSLHVSLEVAEDYLNEINNIEEETT